MAAPVSIQLADRRVELLGPLGQGGSASAWLVAHEDSRCTLKLGTSTSALILASEAERLLLCTSPHLSTVVEAGLLPLALALGGITAPAGAPYLLLSYCPGNPLSAVDDVNPAALARAVARDVGQALADLHRVGVAHGDVKPSNIIVDTTSGSPECSLIDLGLADTIAAESAGGGTLRYLAPEVHDAELPSNARARDSWALGLVLLELLVPGALSSSQPLESLSLCPDGFGHVLAALLNPIPAARPPARWVAEQFQSGDSCAERQRSRISNSYYQARWGELERIARGSSYSVRVGDELGERLQNIATSLSGVARLRGQSSKQSTGERVVLDSLSEAEQRRWLVGLLGPSSIDFPPLPNQSDAALMARLLTLADERPVETFTYAAIVQGQMPPPAHSPTDPSELLLLLGSEAPSTFVIETLERRAFSDGLPTAALMALARALRARHELARALALVRIAQGASARVEEAQILTRVGDAAGAKELINAVAKQPELDSEVRGRALALGARLALMEGDPQGAKDWIAQAPEGTRVLEARASIALTLGHLEQARQLLDRALAFPHSAEERARIEALLANHAQQVGKTEEAATRFKRAAEHAARCGALLEEATYLSGVASTATNTGALSEAIAAAERSELLFRHLAKPESAARAVLSKASALSAAGAFVEAQRACTACANMARLAGDRRCQGYAHLVACDVSEFRAAREHVQRAAVLLGRDRPDDHLRLAARELRTDCLTEELAVLDTLARTDLPTDARLDWWEARAHGALSKPGAERPNGIIENLLALAGAEAAASAKGPAMAYGAQLAAEAGDGESARRLFQAASDAASRLRRGLRPELRLSFDQQRWTQLLRPEQASQFDPRQLRDIETLVLGLGEREKLKTLLDRVLDALVLWTSVERGLLLLRAPNGKLVPRAARNLARADLSGEQLKLSRTLAERALNTAETIVAVDASGELPEVHASVHSLKLRSVLAVPLLARGEVIGVAYLDDRMRRGAFGKQELVWVRLVSTLAAIAIVEARDQLQLRRAARRAQRAEARVTQLLARREAQLMVAESELAQTRERRTANTYDEIIGGSEAMQKTLRLVDRVASSDVPVLIVGESGSGKELIARAIVFNGSRRDHAFVSENCSAIPESLLESTLFGHVKGAFTGANRHHAGLFEVAHGGTLFLDEIADMSLAMQGKLLRALQNGEIRRVGSERAIQVDVRVLGATHKDLAAMVERGEFRQDLYYRLNVITVQVPALRERRSDIPLLLRHFLSKYAEGRQVRVDAAAAARLQDFEWTGNVRQLENEVRRALVLADDEIRSEHLSPEVVDNRRHSQLGLNLRERVDALEVQLVETALKQTKGNQTRASKLLGVSRFGLQKMIRRLGIDIDQLVGAKPEAARPPR